VNRRIRQLTLLLPLLGLAACNSAIYVRDGVTDGDTFYLADRALTDADPVLQSWVTYSLARSTCQLQIGGENPARASSFECEYAARRLLTDTWSEQKADGDAEDAYLDDLARVRDAGYLREYVAHYLKRRDWLLPDDLDTANFERWRRTNLPRHRTETRLPGSWNYARNTRAM